MSADPWRAAASGVRTFTGQPRACSHSNSHAWPPCRAAAQVRGPHAAPCSLHHRITSKLPPSAAASHTAFPAPHGQPFSRANFMTSKCRPRAACTCTRTSHGNSFARSHSSSSKSPAAAAPAQARSSGGQPLASAHSMTCR